MSALKNANKLVPNQMFRPMHISNVRIFATHVQMNVQNTTIRIVRNVKKFAASVQKLVIKLLKQI
jgi:hypothetical protein